MSSDYGIWHKELRAWARIRDLAVELSCSSMNFADEMLLSCFAVFNQYEDAQEWLDASGHTQYEVRRFPV